MTRARVTRLVLAAALAVAALSLSPAQAARLYLISGTVLDGADGQRVVGATVTVRDVTNPFQSSTATTNSQGDFGILFPETAAATVQIVVEAAQSGSSSGPKVTTELFQVTGQRNELITIQAVRDLTASVVLGADGPPVPGATVTASGSSADLQTPSGLGTTTTIPDPSCRTGTDGTCVLPVLTWGTVAGFAVHPLDGYAVSYPGVDTRSAAPLAQTFVLPASHPVSGVLVDSTGAPLSGATVSLVNSATTATTTTAADGSYALSLKPSSVRLRVRGTVEHAGEDVPFDLQTDAFALDQARTVSLAIPALATLRVLVRDALDQPVTDAAVTMNARSSTFAGTTTTGLPFSITLPPADAPPAACASTDSAGACDFPIFLGGVSAGVDVRHPVAGQLDLPGTPAQPGAVRELVARYSSYATVASAGSVPGRFVVTTAGGSIDALSTSAVSPPVGVVAPLGRIDYVMRPRSAGSSAGLGVRLPAGVTPNAAFEVGPDGRFTDVTDTVELSPGLLYATRTDGGPRDADGTANQQVVGTIVPAVVQDPLRITTTRVPGVPKGKPYSFRLDATGIGAPYAWRLVAGSLPSGLSLSPDGVISGTTNDVGAFGVTVGVQNSYGRVVTRELVVQSSPVAITTWQVPDALQGKSYSVTLKATGASFPVWRVMSGGLPPGLSLSKGGVISGTPTVPGTFDVTVMVTSSNGTMSPWQDYRIVVRPMAVVTDSLPDAPVAASYSQKLTAAGGKGTLTWSLDAGTLPSGLTLSSWGTITGRPTTTGSYAFVVRVTDQSSPKVSVTKSLTITVTPMEVAKSSLPDATAGRWYSQPLTTHGGKGTLTWALAAGSLPPRLTLGAGGRITGTPNTRGTWTFTVRVTDSSSPKQQAERTLSLTVG